MFTGKTELTGFGREYTYLKKHGYYFDAICWWYNRTKSREAHESRVCTGLVLFI